MQYARAVASLATVTDMIQKLISEKE